MKILTIVLAGALAGACAADPTPLLYARPDNADAPVDQYQLTTWTPGTELFVAPLRVNVRATAGTGGASAGKAGLGDRVVVEAMEPAAKKEDGLVNHWYRVKVKDGAGAGQAGWVFGAFLTPFAIRADFDGDHQEEVATVSFDRDMKILVRVKHGPEDVAELRFTPSGEGYLSRKGGQVVASLLPADKAGIPLIQLGSHIDACGDYWDAYASYTDGKAREALMLRGASDPPVFQTTTATFTKGAAQVEEDVTEQDEKGKEKKTVTRKSLVLDHGVFKPKK